MKAVPHVSLRVHARVTAMTQAHNNIPEPVHAYMLCCSMIGNHLVVSHSCIENSMKYATPFQLNMMWFLLYHAWFLQIGALPGLGILSTKACVVIMYT